MLSYNDFQLVTLDTETSGRSARHHEIIEFGCVVSDITSQNVRKTYERKVIPVRRVDPQAAAVNGYNPAIWKAQGIPAAQLVHELKREVFDGTPSIVVAHNVDFDWPFLSALAERHQWRPEEIQKLICTLKMARSYGRFQKNNLGFLQAHFGLQPQGTPHTALADSWTAFLLYRELRKLHIHTGAVPALHWWEAKGLSAA